MRVPVTINLNTSKTYQRGGHWKLGNVLQSDDVHFWDKDIPNTLTDICIESIAGAWTERQILEEIPSEIDRFLLLDILATDLPLKLTVPKIPDDVYWRRCYTKRWPKLLPQTSSTEHKWKQFFLEMHVRDFLEQLKPEDYEAEKIKELADLCGDHVKTLNLRELQCAESSPSHIPLNAILTGLQNLTELSLCFKQVYIGDKFTWDVVKVDGHDIQLLAKGLEKCKLRTFRLQNSAIDDDKLTLILKSLLKHDDLLTVDFSHCQISNMGAIALSKFSLISPVTSLVVANNKIGAAGVEALSYAICKSSCSVQALDLKLNPLMEAGASCLIKALTWGARSVRKLLLNGCGMKYDANIGDMIEHNSSLAYLDFSNNALGEEMGKVILQGLRYNTNLKTLDVRMCQLNPLDELEILQKIARNRKRSTSETKPIIIEPQHDFQISEHLQQQIDTIFDFCVVEPDTPPSTTPEEDESNENLSS